MTPRAPSARSASAASRRRAAQPLRAAPARRQAPPARCHPTRAGARPRAAPADRTRPAAAAARRPLDVPRIERRIVRERRPAPDGHRVHRRPPLVHEAPALGRRDPPALPRRGRGAPVERRRELQQHERPALDGMHPERRVLPPRAPLELAARELDLDAGGTQLREALPAHLLRRIARGADHPHDPRRDQRIRTRRLPPVVRAGLERHVGRRPLPLRRRTREQRVRLRVALARTHVPALAEQLAVAHDHAADDGVRARGAASALGELERALEQAGVLRGHAKPAAATIAR